MHSLYDLKNLQSEFADNAVKGFQLIQSFTSNDDSDQQKIASTNNKTKLAKSSSLSIFQNY